MPWKPAKMIRFLKKNGFVELPSKSNGHRYFKNPKTGRYTEVPIHGSSKELPIGTEQAILKQAGLHK